MKTAGAARACEGHDGIQYAGEREVDRTIGLAGLTQVDLSGLEEAMN